MDCVRGRRRNVQLKFTEFRYDPGVGPRRWIGRVRLQAGKYILGITAPTGTGVQALPPWDPRASPFDSPYIGGMLWRNSRRFHSSVPADRRQAASNRTGLGARAEARRLSAADPVRDGRVRFYTINGADWS
jgi:hypothetical protein